MMSEIFAFNVFFPEKGFCVVAFGRVATVNVSLTWMEVSIDSMTNVFNVTSVAFFTSNNDIAANKTSATLEGATIRMLVPGTGSSFSVDSVIQLRYLG